MLKFLNLQPEIFGIEINDLSLRIVKLKKRGRAFRVVSFNEVAMPSGIVKDGIIQDSETLAKTITLASGSVKGQKLGTKYLIASLPEEKSFSQVIQMPKMTEEELKSAVPFEAENYIPLPIDKVYLDFQIVNPYHKDGVSHLDLLINVMPKVIVDSYVACFKQAGLIPYILELESQSIARALVKNNEESLPLLLIDLGVANTGFVVFSGNSVRFTSSIGVSGQQLTQAICEKLQVSTDEAEKLKMRYGLLKGTEKKYNIHEIIKPILFDLVSQIKKYIAFYHNHSYHDILSDGKSNQKIEKIMICGGGANLKGLSDFLKNELKLPVEIGNPFINILSNGNVSRQMIPQQKILTFTTVLGLALRGASEE